jgi:transposase
LRGRVTRHHRFLLKLHLDQIDAIDAAIARIDQEVSANVAVCAVAASLLTTAYYMLKSGSPYRDLGPHHFDQPDKQKQANRLLKQLKHLGYKVQIQLRPA